jgi:NTE family protein
LNGLVLSGGGGRGAYEFGVYKALREGGFRPQVLSGTSVGAITAAAIASGLSLAEMEAMWEELGTFRVLRPRVDYWRFPKWTHFVHLSPLRRFLERHIRFERIRESPVRLRVAAVDVSTGELVVFTNRDLTVEHLLASSAIPILFPMVQIDGRAYWDGGVAANTPIGPAIEAGANAIYVILLSPVGAVPLEPPRNLWEAFTRYSELRLLGNLKEDIKQAQAVNRLIDRGLADPRWRRVEFHIISPAESLGLTSTLNFNARNAKRFIEWGHSDGQRFLRSREQHPVEVQAVHEAHEDALRRERVP